MSQSGDDCVPNVQARTFDWDDSALISAYDCALSLTNDRISAKGKNLTVNGCVDHKKLKKSPNKNRWRVGDFCKAIYEGDKLCYEAEIKEIDEHSGICVVRFIGYGNEQSVHLAKVERSRGQSARDKQIATAEKYNSQSWEVGDFCRAIYSGDGLLYEGKIIDVFEDVCLVKFIGYGNEEEIHFCNLQPSGGKRVRLHQLRLASASINADQDDVSLDSSLLSTASRTSESSDRQSEVRPTCGINCPPNSQRHSQNLFVPPAPMPFPSNPDLPIENDHLGAMLMSWYMAGYHTGYYQAKANIGSNSPCHHDTHSCDGNYPY